MNNMGFPMIEPTSRPVNNKINQPVL